MKILITGSMGVGKTTLSNNLSKVTGYNILPEVAREMIKEGYKLDKKATVEIEQEILKRQLLSEKSKNNFIADRGPIDLLAYCMILLPKEMKFLKSIETAISKAKYDFIFYIPPEFPIEDDGIRSTDVKFRDKVDQQIKEILKRLNLKYYKITGARIENRLKKALKIIKNK